MAKFGKYFLILVQCAIWELALATTNNITVVNQPLTTVLVQVNGSAGDNGQSESTTEVPLLFTEMTFINGGTYITVQRDLDGNVSHCKMARIGTPEKKMAAITNFTTENKPFRETNFHHLLDLMRECDSVNNDEAEEEDIGFGGLIFRILGSPRLFLRGIFPGTKWCGKGKLASGYDDLGPQKGLDRCCRTHDHCPMKVKSKSAAYGLKNEDTATKSHCECDAMFYDCLKKEERKNRSAWLVGKVFFNQLKVECFEERDPPACIERRSLPFQSCLNWAGNINDTAEDPFVFKDVKRRY